ncbi:hypothetical protein COV49_02470, partial [Candidatus Falkowbacteria bacterium CG11_big_fil_rev_8_21_14_0_20_39_10]
IKLTIFPWQNCGLLQPLRAVFLLPSAINRRQSHDDVERLTGVKHAQATKYLKILTKQGKLIRFGKTANTFYKSIGK